MHLRLTVVRDPRRALGEGTSHAFGEAGGSIGRNAGCTLVVADATHVISSRHAEIGFNGRGFVITDISTNGVYLNRTDAPLGRGNSAPLASGDVLYIGDLVFRADIGEDVSDSRARLRVDERWAKVPTSGFSKPPSTPGIEPLPGVGPAVQSDPLSGFSRGLPPAAAPRSEPVAKDPLAALNASEAQTNEFGESEDLLAPRKPSRGPVNQQPFPTLSPRHNAPDAQRIPPTFGGFSAPTPARPSPPPKAPDPAPRAPANPAPIPDFADFLQPPHQEIRQEARREAPYEPRREQDPRREPPGQAQQEQPFVEAPRAPVGGEGGFGEKPGERQVPNAPPALPPMPPPPVPPPAGGPIPDDFLAHLSGLPGFSAESAGGPKPTEIAPPRPAVPQPDAPQGQKRMPLPPDFAATLVTLGRKDGAGTTSAAPMLDPVSVLRRRGEMRREANAVETAVENPPVRPPSAPPLPSADLTDNASRTPAGPRRSGEDFAAFWKILGIDAGELDPQRRNEILQILAATIRETVEGLIEVLSARMAIKDEFHIDRTRLQPDENNPLKFFRSGTEALRRTIVDRAPGFVSLDSATRLGFRDIKAHEVASMTALQNAVAQVVQRLAPTAIEQAVGQSALGRRPDKAKLWDQFVETYNRFTDQLEFAIPEIVATEFAKVYDEQIEQMNRGEPR